MFVKYLFILMFTTKNVIKSIVHYRFYVIINKTKSILKYEIKTVKMALSMSVTATNIERGRVLGGIYLTGGPGNQSSDQVHHWIHH